MLIRRNYKLDGALRTVTMNDPEVCPICHHAIRPESLHEHAYSHNDKRFLSILYLCPSCFQSFVSQSQIEQDSENGYLALLSYLAPQRYEKAFFSPELEQLSPQFAKIYNQALAAESEQLDEIAGLGYRKALEFLVKDFCILKSPDAAERIKQMPLSQCIRQFITNPTIETLATRSVWIGNDEAHYVRKQEDRDVSDMKRFISALVHFVEMELIAIDASSISPA